MGTHVVKQLLDGGAKNLRVLTTASAPAWLEQSGVEIVRGSIMSLEDVTRAVDGVRNIYHLAGRVSRNGDDAHEMYELHVNGTRVLCDAARAAGVQSIVMASTSGTIAVSETGDLVSDESSPTPLDIISRWPYYISKVYQESVARERFHGDAQRLVIINPSLLLGPGDERLGSTKFVLDFIGRKINAVPTGGLSFVDVRDAASAFIAAMDRGRHGERYLLGAANWSFAHLFGRLERLTRVSAPRIKLPSSLAIKGSQVIHALYRHWNMAPPIEPSEIEMAEHFWYLDSSKAEKELDFKPRDPAETLHDTITYIRANFLGNDSF
ncbi:MAG: NAD-dependent epimerase/dehydratase family protein [Pyrinomonadaceae bacterium]